jgi:7-cyano-7-deazaguanine synthase
MKKVVLLSGGVDSSTCLGLAVEKCEADEVLAVNMFYGQKHDREIQSAREVAKHYGVELIELDLSKIFERSNCSLLSHSTQEIEHGSYAEQIKKTGGVKPVATYVPFRNGLMLSAAASIAVSVGASEVWYGAHADDAAGNAYPDCSNAFLTAINAAISEGTAGQVKVIAPFINEPKKGVVKAGLSIGVPYELTWSCYEGGDRPCGKCGTCIDRQKAFEENGVKDPAFKEVNIED